MISVTAPSYSFRCAQSLIVSIEWLFMVPLLLQIWDFPGQIDFFDPTFDSEHIFGGSGALIFVIDAQASYCQPSILIGHLTALSFSRMTIGRL